MFVANLFDGCCALNKGHIHRIFNNAFKQIDKVEGGLLAPKEREYAVSLLTLVEKRIFDPRRELRGSKIR
jgi:hypothetical protein